MLEERFARSGQETLIAAFQTARRLSHSYIGSEHVVLGLLGCGGQAQEALTREGLTAERAERALRERVGAADSCPRGPTLSGEAAAVIERAALLAAAAGEPVGGEHLLLAVLQQPDCGGAALLRACGCDFEALHRRLTAPRAPFRAEPRRRAELKLTLQFGVDMTARAAAGEYDPVVGRERETARVMQILSRRQKGNPVLLGPAGVGKTAVAEALAQRLVCGETPDALRERRLVSLDLASMVAGTKYRGEFEERARAVLREVEQAGDVVLFIDELHTVMGAGAAEGAIDAANILKPALARGRLQVLGATTAEEYKRSVRRDGALARRFQPVEVREPDGEQCLAALRALRPRYERHHGVRILDSALETAVALSDRYLPDCCFPDKAVDLLDESAALGVMERRKSCDGALVRRALEDMLGRGCDEGARAARLEGLEERLRSEVAGQPEAVAAVCGAVRRAFAFGGRDRPLTSLLFCGPSGVGKTSLALALARELYGGRAVIRLDMSEFMEKHSVARLIGSPPGYIGYGEGGQLTERVRAEPESLVLLDEIEKAHPDVLNLLLQILEEGALCDGEGKRASFRRAAVVMTSNLGNEQFGRRSAGFGAAAADAPARVMEAVRARLRPELLGRLDAVAVFRPLESETLRLIAGRELAALRDRAAAAGLRLSWDTETAAALYARLDPAAGARAVRQRVRSEVEEPLAALLLREHPDAARAAVRDGKLVVERPAAGGGTPDEGRARAHS